MIVARMIANKKRYDRREIGLLISLMHIFQPMGYGRRELIKEAASLENRGGHSNFWGTGYLFENRYFTVSSLGLEATKDGMASGSA
jgi:hypothetical protein